MNMRIYTVGIGKQLLTAILLFSFTITFILSSLILYNEYQRDLRTLHTEVKNVMNLQIPSLSQATWTMNRVMQQKLLESITQSHYIPYVSLYDEDDILIHEIGKPISEESTYYTEYALIYIQRGQPITIGKVVIQVTLTPVHNILEDRILSILQTQAIKTLLTSLFILILVHTLISRHLYDILHYVSHGMRQRMSYEVLGLKRKEYNDELQQLVDSINETKQELDENYLQLRQQRQSLTQEVQLRKYAEKKAKNYSEQINTILNSLTDAVFSSNQNGDVLFMNTAASSLLKSAITPENINRKNQKLNDVLNISISEDPNVNKVDLERLTRSHNEIHQINGFCHICFQEQKETIPVNVKLIPGIYLQNTMPGYKKATIIVIRDESDSAKLVEISYNATHDYLTGVLNRYAFTNRLERILQIISDQRFCLAFIDLDRFKLVNDTCGHAAGDELLKQVASAMQQHLESNDMLARLGGDEFAILFESNMDSSIHKAKAILFELENLDFKWRERKLLISGSIGIVELREDDTVETLQNRADEACYRVKGDGGGAIQIQQGELASNLQPNKLHEILSLIEKDRLSLFAQPFFSVNNKLPKRLEILVRIVTDDPESPMIPGDFLPVLEKYYYTPKIDLLVLEKITPYLEGLIDQGWHLNINLSPLTLVKPVNIKQILKFLDSIDRKEKQLCFEITESSLIREKEHVLAFMKAARQRGAIFALDDFGRGYASFGMLQDFSFEIIKIDGKLITRLEGNDELVALVHSIITMAVAMGAKTVAEHVPTEKVLQMLTKMNIDYIQSYHTHPIVSLDEFMCPITHND